jgi:hypothetical protein
MSVNGTSRTVSSVILVALVLGGSFGAAFGFYSLGLNASENNGYDSIDEEGYANGFGEGFENGTDDGYEQGYGEGYDEGYEDGYDNAFNGNGNGITEITPTIDGNINENEWETANTYIQSTFFDTDGSGVDGYNYVSVGRDQGHLYIAVDLCSARTNLVENELVSVAMFVDSQDNFTTSQEFRNILDYGTEIYTEFNDLSWSLDDVYVSHVDLYEPTSNTIDGAEVKFGFGSSPMLQTPHRTIEMKFDFTKIYGISGDGDVYLFIHGNSVVFDLDWQEHDALEGYWFSLGDGGIFNSDNYDCFSLAI